MKRLPEPSPDESRADFIARFIIDLAAIVEFPDDNQRIQIANVIFDTSNI